MSEKQVRGQYMQEFKLEKNLWGLDGLIRSEPLLLCPWSPLAEFMWQVHATCSVQVLTALRS